MNPFADSALAADYEAWYETIDRQADQPKKEPLVWLLARFLLTVTLLEAGCGSVILRAGSQNE